MITSSSSKSNRPGAGGLWDMRHAFAPTLLSMWTRMRCDRENSIHYQSSAQCKQMGSQSSSSPPPRLDGLRQGGAHASDVGVLAEALHDCVHAVEEEALVRVKDRLEWGRVKGFTVFRGGKAKRVEDSPPEGGDAPCALRSASWRYPRVCRPPRPWSAACRGRGGRAPRERGTRGRRSPVVQAAAGSRRKAQGRDRIRK